MKSRSAERFGTGLSGASRVTDRRLVLLIDTVSVRPRTHLLAHFVSDWPGRRLGSRGDGHGQLVPVEDDAHVLRPAPPELTRPRVALEAGRSLADNPEQVRRPVRDAWREAHPVPAGGVADDLVGGVRLVIAAGIQHETH